MARTLSQDYESFSGTDIRLGLHKYFSDPLAHVICLGYAFDHDEPKVWFAPRYQWLLEHFPGDYDSKLDRRFLERLRSPSWARLLDAEDFQPEPFPADVLQHYREGGIVRAWNNGFEWRAHHALLSKEVPDLPPLALANLRCTQAEAMAMGFPAALGKTGGAMGLDERIVKDPKGAKLIKLCCVPTPDDKTRTLKSGTASTTVADTPSPQDYADLGKYCAQDVTSERAIAKRLVRLPSSERNLWALTQRMNDRGVRVDVPLVRAIVDTIKPMADDSDRRVAALTDGQVRAATERDRLILWLMQKGVWLDDLRKKTVEIALGNPRLDPTVREVLELRKDWAKASPRKLDAMSRMISNEILRDQLLYFGAHTGRWSSVGVQLQNLPRPPKKFKPDQVMALFKDRGGHSVEEWREKTGGLGVMDAAAAMIRGCLIARDGYDLLIGDYSTIEARVVAWLAGEEKLLAAFRDPTRDVYCEMASIIYDRPIIPNKEDQPAERQIGKTTVLGCGYQLSAHGLRLQLEYGSSLELAQSCVNAYRETYEEIPRFWWALQKAVIDTVKTGEPRLVGKIWSRMKTLPSGDRYLVLTIPSGRHLWYFKPSIVEFQPPWSKNPADKKEAVQYLGPPKQGFGSWAPRIIYGGFLAENLTQATARDIMAHAMARMEGTRGWHLLLTVHDEIVVERHKSTGPGADEFHRLMVDPPPWTAGLPIAAEVLRPTNRYGK